MLAMNSASPNIQSNDDDDDDDDDDDGRGLGDDDINKMILINITSVFHSFSFLF